MSLFFVEKKCLDSTKKANLLFGSSCKKMTNLVVIHVGIIVRNGEKIMDLKTNMVNLNLISTMKNKGIIMILLFLSYFSSAQKVTFHNKSNGSITLFINSQSTKLKSNESFTLKVALEEIICTDNKNEIFEFENFLEPTDELTIQLLGKRVVRFEGNKSKIYDYIYCQLNKDVFSKYTTYQMAKKTGDMATLKLSSEMLLSDIMKKTGVKNIFSEKEDSPSINRLKNTIKYHWLYALFELVKSVPSNHFYINTLRYYYKYILPDIAILDCNYAFSGGIKHEVYLRYLENNKLLGVSFPKYDLVKSSENDQSLLFLPKKCQAYFFLNKYKYSKKMQDPSAELYYDILVKDFKYHPDLLIKLNY